MESTDVFGEFLKKLIKSVGMTQAEFYTALGIKKPYFYDIVSGRVKPPPYSLQFKATEILKIEENVKKHFFDLAAKGRGEMPADIAKWIEEDPKAIENIREGMKRAI